MDDAAEWFLEHSEVRDGEIDASGEIWIFSGGRAGREFLRRIRERVETRGLALVPPAISTPGVLERHVVDVAEIAEVPASEVERRLAWSTAVLDAAREGGLQPLLDAERASPVAAWKLADRLIAVVDELRGEGIDPESFAREMAGDDADRWRGIAAVEQEVRRRLGAVGLLEPGMWRDAAIAMLRPGRCRVVAAGVLEWSGWQRRMLEAVGAEVLIAAPANRSEAYDGLGAVVPEAWIGRSIDCGDGVVAAATVHDAAELVLDEIDRRAAEIETDAITIGVADDALLPAMLRAARAGGLSVHAAPVEPLIASAPGRAIERLHDLLERESVQQVAALLRHGHVSRWLAAEEGKDLPIAFTALVAEGLLTHPDRLLEACDREPRSGRSADRAALAEARRRLKAALERLAGVRSAWSGPPRSSSAWARDLAEWLAEIFEVLPVDDTVERDRLRDDLAACAELLRSFSGVSAPIDPPIGGAAFLARLLDLMRRARRGGPTPSGDEVEAVGWLELAAEPAPHLIVLGLHDGAVPGPASTDPLLAESVRERLGLASQRRRLARDIAMLEGLSWRLRCGGSLRIVVPQRAVDGTPMLPSRLLLGGEGEGLARRVLALTAGETAPPAVEPDGGGSRFAPAAPDPEARLPERLSVTSIRRYLADPYRFYLAHVEGLEEVAEGRGELDARGFGTFAHAVVEMAGRRPEWATATTREDLLELLETSRSELSTAWFGACPAVPVRLQMRNLGRRLERLAEVEARSRAEGWVTEHIEARLDASLEIGDGAAPQRIVGRIDRIDRHPGSGRIRILDYKTGDKAVEPAAAHRRGRPPNHRWIDLQLPLYRHLHAVQHGIDESTVEVGYVTLAAGARGVDVRMLSQWSDAEFAEAIEKARDVVRAIRDREFDSSGPARHPDEFSNLCGEPVLADGGSLDEATAS